MNAQEFSLSFRRAVVSWQAFGRLGRLVVETDKAGFILSEFSDVKTRPGKYSGDTHHTNVVLDRVQNLCSIKK